MVEIPPSHALAWAEASGPLSASPPPLAVLPLELPPGEPELEELEDGGTEEAAPPPPSPPSYETAPWQPGAAITTAAMTTMKRGAHAGTSIKEV